MRSLTSLVALLAALLAGGCTSFRPLATTRPARPVPAGMRAPFEYEPSVASATHLVERTDRYAEHDLEIYTPPGAVEPDVRGWFFDASTGPDDRRPAVVVLPILAGGYQAERIVARTLARRGISAVVLTRNSLLFGEDRQPDDVMASVVHSIRGARRAVDWLSERPGVDPDRLGSVGISLGGIMLGYLAAAEPRLKAHAIIIGGGDLPHLVDDSWEFLVRRWRNGQVERAGTREMLLAEMESGFEPDPLDLAAYQDPSRFFVVIARHDWVVGTEYQQALWRALGEPEALFVSAGHYTTALYIPAITSGLVSFFQRSFSPRRAVAEEPGDGAAAVSSPRAPGWEGPLAVKARAYAERIESLHRSSEGLNLYSIPPAHRRSHPERYGDLADTAVWTGALLAAESYRYAATGDPAALAAARRSVDGLHALQEVTGIPGLFARSIDRDPEAARRGGPWRRGAGAWSDVHWRGDISKDQLIGVMFGYGIALRYVDDPALRARIAADVAPIADRILEAGGQILGADGHRTTYGDLDAEFWGLVPIGLNALISLATFRVAHEATGEERFRRAHDALVKEEYPEIARWAKFEALGRTNHSNDSMAFMAYAVLLELEDDPALRLHYARSLERTWSYVGAERNSFFNYVYAGLHRPARRAIADAVGSLRGFPPRKVLAPVDLTGRPGIEVAFWRNRRGDPRSTSAIPVEDRPVSSFLWKSCPHALLGGRRPRRTVEYAGTDYLLAYWMGRRFGFLTAGD